MKRNQRPTAADSGDNRRRPPRSEGAPWRQDGPRHDGPRYGAGRDHAGPRYGGENDDRPPRRPFNNDGPRYGGDRPQRRTYGSEGGPQGSTYRREGAQGGWNRPAQRPEARPEHRAPARIVPARKLKEGIAAANRALAEIMDEFGQGIQGNYDISELEAALSFDTDGRFLGFGQGGSATITLSLTPLNAEDILEDVGGSMTEQEAMDDEDLEEIEDDEADAADASEDDDLAPAHVELDAADDEAGDDFVEAPAPVNAAKPDPHGDA